MLLDVRSLPSYDFVCSSHDRHALHTSRHVTSCLVSSRWLQCNVRRSRNFRHRGTRPARFRRAVRMSWFSTLPARRNFKVMDRFEHCRVECHVIVIRARDRKSSQSSYVYNRLESSIRWEAGNRRTEDARVDYGSRENSLTMDTTSLTSRQGMLRPCLV